MVAIMGTSGVGKSTLLHILATLDRPDSGTLQLAKQDVLQLKGKKLATFRNRYIGLVFQDHYLLPEFSTLENVCMPGYLGNFEKNLVQANAQELLRILHIDHRASHKPAELSGGEQQRAAVARALINTPKIIFADEPSGSLDEKNAVTLHQLFLELRKKFNQAFVFATHNQVFANMADRTLLMQDGKLFEA